LAIYASTFLAADFGGDQARRRPGRDQAGMAAAEGLEELGARCSHPTPVGASLNGSTDRALSLGSVHMHRYIPTLLAVVVSVVVRSELEAS